MPDLSAIGIDLGTTYSAAAQVNNHGVAEIIPNAETERLTPSAVFFDDDTIIVGQTAKDAAAAHPDRVVQFVKREIGKPDWFFITPQRRYTPADVSAIILKKLKQDSEQRLGHPLPYVVITVPAYFDDVRRRETITAGQIAGFQVLDLINEPTAAAIAFGADGTRREETVLVYDLGGGTLDVTIMRLAGQRCDVLATDGDALLGGKDFDDALIRRIVEQFQREHGCDPNHDPSEAWDIRAQAEKAKRELSKRTKTLLVVRAQGFTSRVEVTREQFDALIKPKLDTSLAIVRSALSSAKLTPQQIDRVLLIGGSTRIPAVQALLGQFFGKLPDTSVNPDEAVALGAALIAAKRVAEVAPTTVTPQVAEKVGGLQITDVTSHSLGIEAFVPGTTQRINSILIPRNTPIPAEVSKEFITNQAGQTAIKVTIFQGEFQQPELCMPVGEFLLGGLPPNRAAGRKVRVTVSCTSSGVVNVTAVDIESGLQTTTTVSYKVGQSPEQVSAKRRWMEASEIA